MTPDSDPNQDAATSCHDCQQGCSSGPTCIRWSFEGSPVALYSNASVCGGGSGGGDGTQSEWLWMCAWAGSGVGLSGAPCLKAPPLHCTAMLASAAVVAVAGMALRLSGCQVHMGVGKGLSSSCSRRCAGSC